MRSGASLRPEAAPGRRWALLWLLAITLLLGWGGKLAHAEAAPSMVLERTPEGLYLSARLPLSLPESLQEVMLRGVPLHFVWQADLRRARWYWTDQRLSGATRVVRVAYQPLTRRWRVSLLTHLADPVGDPGLANALHQNLDTLDAALAVVSRVTRWQVATNAQLAERGPDWVDVEFRLDAGLLPHLWQIGQPANPGTGLTVRQSLAVPPTVMTHIEGGGS